MLTTAAELLAVLSSSVSNTIVWGRTAKAWDAAANWVASVLSEAETVRPHASGTGRWRLRVGMIGGLANSGVSGRGPLGSNEAEKGEAAGVSGEGGNGCGVLFCTRVRSTSSTRVERESLFSSVVIAAWAEDYLLPVALSSVDVLAGAQDGEGRKDSELPEIRLGVAEHQRATAARDIGLEKRRHSHRTASMSISGRAASGESTAQGQLWPPFGAGRCPWEPADIEPRTDERA